MKVTRVVIVAALVASGLLVGAQSASAHRSGISSVRAATAEFHDVNEAIEEGWSIELHDLAGIACIDNPLGGMGIHYVNGALVGDGQINARTPEAIIYQPRADGSLKMVAVEYVVLKADWEKTHHSVPRLFGQSFELVLAGNRFGLPDFYELHAWIWKHNPAGMFEDWNPTVSCP